LCKYIVGEKIKAKSVSQILE